MMVNTMFPSSTEKISVIGLGTWVFGGDNWGGAQENESLAALEEAIGHGVNFIDTAPFYGDGLSEKIIGQVAVKQRERMFIATKCGLIRRGGRIAVDLSAKSIRDEIDLSLGRLRCDFIDLYQIHWPDKATPIENTMETLLQLQKEKKIRHIGLCNVDTALLERALRVAPVRTIQVQYSLLERTIEERLLPFCRENGIGVITYGSLGGGILTGKYATSPSFSKSDARKMFYKFYEGKMFEAVQKGVNQLKTFARPLNEVVLNWTRQQPGILTVLVGCRTRQQVLQNLATTDWNLSDDDLRVISQIDWFRA